MMAPEKTTRAIIEWLNTKTNEVLTDPDVRERPNLALLACQAQRPS
jgi:tripartite-type tricarboxylate transporter receptor subunit TctC